MAKKPARRPLGRSRRAELNVIDYTLAKRAILRDTQRGLQSVNDLCDAHPELMRAAKYVGEPTRVDCPVCGKDKLVLLAYVYGDAPKHDNGRVWSIDTGLRMAAASPGSWRMRSQWRCTCPAGCRAWPSPDCRQAQCARAKIACALRC